MEEKEITGNLNNKYKTIEENPAGSQGEKAELSADGKEKEQKFPKEKKVKEPKPPKEKKVKEPKPAKEKKVKEPKPAKEKKVKEPKPPKEKKVKEPKPPKEKKVKEPKPPKEKKVKEPKPPKEKKVKEPKPPKEKKPKEPLGVKDYVTIAIAVIAVVSALGFAVYRFYDSGEPAVTPGENTQTESKVSDIQVVRDGISVINLIKSDIPNVFYGFTADMQLRFYQYRDEKMVEVASTGTLETSIDLGNQTIPVKVDYVKLGDRVFGMGVFRADEHEDVYFYNLMVFRLTDLPAAYKSEGKALLLATTSENALSQKEILWPESFTVDLQSGATARFLSIVNRTIDMNGAGVQDFCMLTTAGYTASGNGIPFLTSREYEQGSGKQDIFVKNGSHETLFASDVYGKFLLSDGEAVVFMRKTETGFDLIRKSGETEETLRSFYGSMSEYLYSDGYLLNLDNGKVCNLLTGEEKTLVGYRMTTPMLMQASEDGKYLVIIGTVNNEFDYQVHIFNLENGEYMKYTDKNPSAHSDLAFIDNHTAVYTVVDPNQGNEYVVLDLEKIE